MTTDDRRSNRPTSMLVAGALVWGVGALVWRAGWTLDGTAPWLSIPLLAVEVWALIRLVLLAIATASRPSHDDPVDNTDETPEILLLVPVAHATAVQLGRTLVVAKADPAGGTMVLDDRHRPDVEAEAERHGAEYRVIESAQGSVDTRAALVGAVLVDTDAAIVAWVDAGDVLAPGLAELAAPFRRRDVAVVQAATDYSNRDSLLHSSPRHDERAVDEHVMGPALGTIGAAPWNGSGSLVRVAALRDIGGLTGSIGTTTVAALDLAAAGWRTEFCRRPVVRVAAPDTLEAYLAAAAHRATGPWRTLTGPSSVLTPRGLGLRRRLVALEAATRPIDGAARLALLAVLALTIWTGRLPMTASIVGLALCWAPAHLLRFRALMALAGGTLDTGDLTRQSLRRLGVHLQIMTGRTRFGSAGNPEPDRRRSRRRTARVLGQLPLVSAAAVVLNTGIIARALTFWFPHLLRPLSDTARIVVMGAAVGALIPMVDVLQVLINRQQRRASHRVNAVLLAEVAGTASKAHDLTPTGLGVDVVDAPAVGDRVPVVLAVPRVTGALDDIHVTGIVKHVSDPYRGARLSRRGGAPLYRVGLQLVDVGPDERDALVELCALTASERDRVRDRRAEHTPDALDLRSPRGWRTGLAALNVVGLLTAGLVVVGAPAGAETTPAEQAKVAEQAAKKATPPETKDAPMGTSVIYGRVTNDQGESVAGLCVGLRDIDAPSTVTDGDGWFALEQLPAGEHIVAAEDCKGVGGGFATTFHPSTAIASQAKPVTTTDGEKTEIKIQMVTTGTVYGEVINERKESVADVCIAFLPQGDDTRLEVGRTDSDGRYAVAVPGGSGSFVFTDCSGTPRYAETWWPGVTEQTSAKVVDVIAHDKVTLDRFVMAGGARLSGRVTNRDGKPLAEVCVSIQDVANGQWTNLASTSTDGDGAYDFAVPTGSHSLFFQDCGKDRNLVATWFGGAPTATNPAPTIEIGGGQQQFDQVMESGSRMGGVVLTPDGEPAQGACIALHPAKQLLDQDDWTTAYWGRPDPKSGEWTSDPLPDGTYLLQFVNCDDQGYRPSGAWVEEFLDGIFPQQGGNVRDSEQLELSIKSEPIFVKHQLRRASRLAGTVTRKGVGQGDVCVGTTPAAGTTRTAADGTWSLDVTKGDYRVTFTDCRSGRGLQQLVDKVGIGDGEVRTLDAEMRRGKVSSLTGRIVAGDGGTPTGACVVAYVPNDVVAVGVVSPKGTWELSGLGAGDYWLGATDCERPGSPIASADGTATYPTTWYPAAPADLATGVDPDRDGGKAVRLESGSSQDDLEICLGNCSGSPTTEPPLTVPPVTAPPTTAVPTTAVPTTATPTTAVPTTATPTTAVPTTIPRTTVPPTTTAPTTTTPRTTIPSTTAAPTTTTPPAVTEDPAVGTGSRAAAMTSGNPDAAPERRPGTPATTGLGATTSTETSAGAGVSGSSTDRGAAPRPGTGTRADGPDRAEVEGISANAPTRADGASAAPDELAFSDAPGPTIGRSNGPTDDPWVVIAGLGITVLAAAGLLLARRRSSES